MPSRFQTVLGFIALLATGLAGISNAAEAPGGALQPPAEIHVKVDAPLTNGSPVEAGLIKSSDRISSALERLIDRKAAGQARGGRLPMDAARDRIRVMFETAEGTPFDPDEIVSLGGRILRQMSNLIAAELPPDRIETLLNANPNIRFARLPHRFHPTSVTSEGVALSNGAYYPRIGYGGAGVKVAVIDIGFKGLTAAKTSGDLPPNVVTRDFTGRGLETQYKHGTACAEIVHDMAPDAELHLLKVADEQDLYDAFAYCIEQGVHVVNLSIVTFGSGPGNGTGPIHDACDAARANGVVVVAAAGNGGIYVENGVELGTHWEGVFTDADGDNVHEFAAGIQGNRLIGIGACDDDGNPEDGEVTVIMRWNDWPFATTDYDFCLYNYDYPSRTRGALVGCSAGTQDGSQPPVEELVFDIPGNQTYRYFELVVTRKPDSPAGKELEIALLGNSAFFGISNVSIIEPVMATSAGSIMEPADAASVLAVGAFNQDAGYVEQYSSRGPTNAWAGSGGLSKPNLVAPDKVSTYTYGTYAYGTSFEGTSAAAPHVAGAAALLKSLHRNIQPDQIRYYLGKWAKTGLGTPSDPNVRGAGKLWMEFGDEVPRFQWIEEKSIAEGQLLRFTVSASDPDGDDVTYEIPYYSFPEGATLDPITGAFSWRPSHRLYEDSYSHGAFSICFIAREGPVLSGYGETYVHVRVIDAPPRGDLDDSGRVDLKDAVVAQRVLAGLDVAGSLRTDYAASGADVNEDSEIGVQELIFVLQILADLR
ncbi:MAG: S8 family serine peptidase [Deltaproteobacteria bacterium]|nr:S8 family serine peptidase [Deltaproteobacteria bacterium]